MRERKRASERKKESVKQKISSARDRNKFKKREIDLPEHVCNGLLVLRELFLENLELHPELGVGEVCIVQVLLQHAVLTLQVRSPEYKIHFELKIRSYLGQFFLYITKTRRIHIRFLPWVWVRLIYDQINKSLQIRFYSTSCAIWFSLGRTASWSCHNGGSGF